MADVLIQSIEAKKKEVSRLQGLVTRREAELRQQAKEVEDLEHVRSYSNQAMHAALTEARPEDFLDCIQRLHSRLKLQEMRNAGLQREIYDTKLHLEHKAADLERYECLHVQIHTATGCKTNDTRRRGSGLSHQEQEMALAELQLLKMVLEKEHHAAKSIIRKKDELIRSMMADVAILEATEELHHEVAVRANSVKRELCRVSQEYDEVMKEHEKADLDLAKFQRKIAEMTTPQALESDKQYLKMVTLRNMDERRRQDDIIKAQSARIASLQKRVDLLTHAMSDLKVDSLVRKKMKGILVQQVDSDPVTVRRHGRVGGQDQLQDVGVILAEDENVDTALFNLLSVDLEQTKERIKIKDILLAEKEGTVEALEEKLQWLQESSAEQMDANEEKLQWLEKEVIRLHSSVWEDRKQFREDLGGLRKEKMELQRRYYALVQQLKDGIPS